MNNSALTIRLSVNGRSATVMHLAGQLNGSNFEHLVETAKKVYRQTQRQIILDLAQLKKITLAGLFGLHGVAAILNGKEPLTPEAGWAAIRAMKNDLEDGFHTRLKIANPRPQICHQLYQAGFTDFVDIYEELATETAVFTVPAALKNLEKEQQQPAAHVVHHRKQPAGYLVKALNLIGILPKA